MHNMLLLILSFWQGIWRFVHTFIGMVALGSWLAAPPLGGYMAYCQNEERQHRSLRGFLRYVFPRDILSQPSCRLDFLHLGSKLLLRPLLQTVPLLGIFAVTSTVYACFVSAWGAEIPVQSGVPAHLAIMLVLVLILDAAYFHVHYLQHKIKVLWELHKVHHSTEWLLLMLSNRRAHPIEEILGGIMNGMAAGTGTAILCYALHLNLQETLNDSGHAYLLLNALSFYHLRHSHLKLGYGWFERYVISPSQHHIHHAYETHLWDKNFGWLLSIWDRMYGTLVYSKDARMFPVGLPLAQRGDYDTAWKLMAVPISKIAHLTWTASILAATRCTTFFTTTNTRITARKSRPPLDTTPAINLEELDVEPQPHLDFAEA